MTGEKSTLSIPITPEDFLENSTQNEGFTNQVQVVDKNPTILRIPAISETSSTTPTSIDTSVSVPECRICFETDNTPENPLFSPCRCCGNSRYIHRNCLKQWRYQHSEGHQARLRCGECMTEYQIETSKSTCHRVDRFIAKYVQFLIKHSIFAGCLYLLTAGWMAEGVCKIPATNQTLDQPFPYQVNGKDNCLIPINLLMLVFHLLLEARAYCLVRRTLQPNLPQLRRSLVAKSISSIPWIYFYPGGFTILWYILSVLLYERYYGVSLVELGSHEEVLDYQE